MSNVKYKPGDIVRVRKDLGVRSEWGGVNVVGDMLGLRGREVTIKSVKMITYEIEESYWYWNDEMFEDRISTAEIDNESRTDDAEISSDMSMKDLFGLYNL